jgi:hypothetical protein
LPTSQRYCSDEELAKLRADSEQTIFCSAYERHLGESKYEAMLRKRYFTFTTANIENYERLFILEPENTVTPEAAIECITRLSRKYFRCGKSPQPYLCFRGMPSETDKYMKRSLMDCVFH